MKTITLVKLIILAAQYVTPAPYVPEVKVDIDSKSNELDYVKTDDTTQESSPPFKDSHYEVNSTISPDETFFDFRNRNDDQFSTISSNTSQRKSMDLFQSVGKSVFNTGLSSIRKGLSLGKTIAEKGISNVASVADNILGVASNLEGDTKKSSASLPPELQSDKTPSKSLFDSIARNGLSTIRQGLSLGKTIVEKGISNVSLSTETAAGSERDTNKTLSSLDLQTDKTPSKSLFESIAQNGLSSVRQTLALGKTLVENGLPSMKQGLDFGKTLVESALTHLPKSDNKTSFISIVQNGIPVLQQGLDFGKNLVSIADKAANSTIHPHIKSMINIASSLPGVLTSDKNPMISMVSSIFEKGLPDLGGVGKMLNKYMEHGSMIMGIVEFIKSLLSNRCIPHIIITFAIGLITLLFSSKR